MSTSAAQGARLSWDRDGRDWPLRETSRFVRAGGLQWHCQISGTGPAVVLIHGTGAATHTWRDLAPLLAAHYRVIGFDLPGHGFTDPLPRGDAMLSRMSAAVAALLAELQVTPTTIVGHSAGAAVAARMCIDGLVAPRSIVGINGALLPPRWMPVSLYASLARVMASTSVVPRFFVWGARDDSAITRMVASTGSSIDARGRELYGRLARSEAHVANVLAMLAGWDLAPLVADLPRLDVPLLLISASRDRTVPPEEVGRARELLPALDAHELAGVGHLAHEEQPESVAGVIRDHVERILEQGGSGRG